MSFTKHVFSCWLYIKGSEHSIVATVYIGCSDVMNRRWAINHRCNFKRRSTVRLRFCFSTRTFVKVRQRKTWEVIRKNARKWNGKWKEKWLRGYQSMPNQRFGARKKIITCLGMVFLCLLLLPSLVWPTRRVRLRFITTPGQSIKMEEFSFCSLRRQLPSMRSVTGTLITNSG